MCDSLKLLERLHQDILQHLLIQVSTSRWPQHDLKMTKRLDSK
jgi:hypothetical protein